MNFVLVMGSRNTSSWSFRPWLALRQGRVAFEEVVIELRRSDTVRRIAEWSPSSRVPVLMIDGRPIWDSMAICELAAELAPELWPADPIARAHARAVSAEMHSGFAPLRRFLPMDFAARFAPPGMLLREVARDVARIEAIWTDCRRRHGEAGPFLFGAFSIADAMYAPVISRFQTYGIEVGADAQAYMTAMRALPAWEEWAAACAAEEQGPARAAVAAWAESLADDSMSPGPVTAAQIGSTAGEQAPRGLRPELAPQSQAARARVTRAGEIKPIGDGIHRRR